MELASLEELKGYLRLKSNDRDELLTGFLQDAVSFIEEASGRVLTPDPEPDLDEDGVDQSTPVIKTFNTYGRRIVRISDVRDVVEVKLAGTVISARGFHDSGGYTLMGEPPYRRLSLAGVSYPVNPYGDLEIKGRFGLYPIPKFVRGAVLTMTARIYNERNTGFSDASTDMEGGRLDYYWKIAPDRVLAAISMLRPIDHEVTL